MQWKCQLNLSVIKWPREEIKRIISVKTVICSYHYTIPTRDLSTHPIFPQSKKKGSLQIQALLPNRCVFKSWLYDLQAPWQGDAAWLPRLSHKALCIGAFTFGALSCHVRVSRAVRKPRPRGEARWKCSGGSPDLSHPRPATREGSNGIIDPPDQSIHQLNATEGH